MLVISIDVDVGNKELGIINGGRNDRNVNNYLSEYFVGAVEERALPLFVDLFDQFEVPVTFGARGQWLEFPNSALDQMLGSSTKHDIGAHGFTHRRFGQLSSEEADIELKMILTAMKRHKIFPRSFIFPGNSVAHLDIIAKHGFKCYREYGDFLEDDMYIRHNNCLWDVHPSLYIDKNTMFSWTKRILDMCIEKRLPFHIWFHLWNFGHSYERIQSSIKRIFIPLLDYAKRNEENGILTFETMLSATEMVEKHSFLQLIL
jgi:peptidoglycan/xylan/chitin deacetylase (PgdA/CDA1 family)